MEIEAAIGLHEDATGEEREIILKAFVESAIEDQADLELRRVESVSLGHTETEDEANERKMAEMEMAHEREQERRFAEHVDRNGYF